MPGKEKLRRIAEPIDARGVILGKKYTDSITKIKGTAVLAYLCLTGCDQVSLSYVNNGRQEYLTVDASRLVELEMEEEPRRGGPAFDMPERIPA